MRFLGQTPLYCACKVGNIDMVITLLNIEGILIDKTDLLFGSTPLHGKPFNWPISFFLLPFTSASCPQIWVGRL